ncbi:MAG: hypothetical protein AAGF57_04650 [Pseudomonadota bacterium]
MVGRFLWLGMKFSLCALNISCLGMLLLEQGDTMSTFEYTLRCIAWAVLAGIAIYFMRPNFRVLEVIGVHYLQDPYDHDTPIDPAIKDNSLPKLLFALIAVFAIPVITLLIVARNGQI